MGQNRRWRRAMVDAVVAGIDTQHTTGPILDVATGTAGVALALARRTTAKVVGVDLTTQMVARGQANVHASSWADRITLCVGRGEQLPFEDGTFDALTFTYLLRYVEDPAATMAELARVVRPGGTVANLEFLVPPTRFWRAWWWGFTRLVLPLGGAITGGAEWFRVGRFLGPNISAHYRRYPVDWTVDAWHDAGLVDVQVRAMSLGGGLVMWGRKAGG